MVRICSAQESNRIENMRVIRIDEERAVPDTVDVPERVPDLLDPGAASERSPERGRSLACLLSCATQPS